MSAICFSTERLARQHRPGPRPGGARCHRVPSDPFIDFHGVQVRRSDLEKAGLVATLAC